VPEHQGRQRPVPNAHPQPATGPAGTVANDMHMHVDWLHQIGFGVHWSAQGGRRLSNIGSSVQKYFVSD
jgi:hypothetical protein